MLNLKSLTSHKIIIETMDNQSYWLQNMIVDSNCSDTTLVQLGAVRHDFGMMQKQIDSLYGYISTLQSNAIQIPTNENLCTVDNSFLLQDTDALPDALPDDLFDFVDSLDHEASAYTSSMQIDVNFINSLATEINSELVAPAAFDNSAILINLPVKISTYSVNERDTFARAHVANDRFIHVLNSASPSDMYEENAVLQMKSTGKPRDTDEHTRVAAELQFFCKLVHKVYGIPMQCLWQLSLLTDRRCMTHGCKSLSGVVGGKWCCVTCSLNKKGNKMTWDEGFLACMQTPHHQRLRHIVPIDV